MTVSATKSFKLTARHIDTLTLVYRFRFLTRPQIQRLLRHKHHRQVIQWLNDLTDEQYLRKYYDRKSAVVPATYSLGRLSREVLKAQGKTSSELKRIRWEENSSETFRSKCSLIADMYLELLQTGGALRFWTKADLQGFENLIEPTPDAYFIFKAKRYFLDVFTAVPTKVLYARANAYSDYFYSGVWQKETGTEFPEIILQCANQAAARRLNCYIENELPNESDLRFLVSSDRALTKLFSIK